MATLDHAAIELAESLAVEAVPAKLRCGSCNKLAVNAVKLPCCDQSICEPCSQDLPESCPICGHSPLSSGDCKANKSLRMTVKAFIKSEEKKRSREAEAPAVQPVTNTAVATPDTSAPVATIEPQPNQVAAEEGATGTVLDEKEDEILQEPVASIEQPQEARNEEGSARVEGEQADDDDDEDDDDDVIITTERPDEDPQPTNSSNQQQQMAPQDHSIDPMQMNGQQGMGFDMNAQNFGNMDFGAINFNPMMAMQNSMSMGNFPMGMPNMLGNGMGMPGMNMDPSMMFGGAGGSGFGGMNMNDMNMMNMAMGMGGMGAYGGGMGGMNGPQTGFFPGQGGYNHQNFGNQMNHSFHNRGYGRPYGRGGYGRGRGGFGFNRGGRGGWQNFPNHHQGQAPYMNQQQQSFAGHSEQAGDSIQGDGRRGSPSYEAMKTSEANTIDSNVATQHVENGGDTNTERHENTDQAGTKTSDGESVTKPVDDEQDPHASQSWKEMAGDSVIDHSGAVQNGHDNYGNQHNSEFASHDNGGFPGGRGGFRGGRGNAAYGYVATVGDPQPTQQPAPPINAPTGPKAMRAGLPNSGFYSRSQPAGLASSVSQPPSQLPEEPRSAVVAADDGGSREQSKSRSRSRSHHRSRRHRHRSPEADHESDETYERRKERERRKRRDRDSRHGNNDDEVNGEHSSSKGRSRSESPVEKSSKRQHRERDEEGYSSRSRRDRSRDRKRHHGRSRSPNRNGDEDSRHKSKSDRVHGDNYDQIDRLRDRDRAKHRGDSSRERRSSRHDDSRDAHESSRRTKSHATRDENSSRKRERDRDPERGSRPVLEQPEDDVGFKIKGGSRRQAHDSPMGPPEGPKRRDRNDRSQEPSSVAMASPSEPPGDSYAAERQAREQARLERHRSQLAQTGRSNSLGKRTERDDEAAGVPTGPKGYSDGSGSRRGKKARPMSYKYEDEIRERYDDGDGKRRR